MPTYAVPAPHAIAPWPQAGLAGVLGSNEGCNVRLRIMSQLMQVLAGLLIIRSLFFKTSSHGDLACGDPDLVEELRALA